MSVDLYQLDRIQDYDRAIAILDKFVQELVTEFVASVEGQAYLKAQPEMIDYVGSWIDHLIYFGYAYESVTLPNMTMNNIEVIVAQIFPRKISLLNPQDANTIIPELTAFWQFLKREYQHPQAHKIIKFLKQLESKFPSIMNDSNNFGFAKSFLMSGMAAGFDMTTEEGIKKYQQHHNQELGATNANQNLESIGSLLSNLGVPGAELLSPNQQQELDNMLQELASEMLAEFPEEALAAEEFKPQLENKINRQLVPETPEIPQQTQIILQQQQITATTPGTILQDFQMLLEFIGDEGIAVGGKRNLIPMKSLAQINQQLAEPIQTELQRPQQKSYPTINGLYLLLRASALGKVVQQGKKVKLKLNFEMLNSWQQMNPTERYFNLLDIWLIVANEEMLGERRYMTEGTRCLQYWSRMPAKGERFKDYKIQENLKYYPGFHNLALMKLFGLVEANYGKPEAGKGWRIKNVRQTAWGRALIQAAFQGWTYPEMIWDDQPVDTEFGKLQPVLQPYFPQWQKIIELPQIESQQGVYVFKVSWQKIWRRIAISSDSTLWDLSQLILQSVDFDADHLDMFSFKNQLGRTVRVAHPYMEESPSTDEMKIADLPLDVGSMMEYVFDFGDNWEFGVQLEEIQPEIRSNYGEIIASKGKAPEQYPDWEES